MLQRVDRSSARLTEQRTFVAAVAADARRVAHHLAERRCSLKLRHVTLDLFIELQPLLLEEQSNRGRRERRGRGADPESRFRRHRHFLLDVRPTKTFGPHDLVGGADRNRYAGRFCSLTAARTICRPCSAALAQRCVGIASVNGGHVLRRRVKGHRRGADVHEQAEDSNRDQADRNDDRDDPDLRPILFFWSRCPSSLTRT